MGTGMTERLHLWAFSGCLSENKQKQIYALVFIEYIKKKCCMELSSPRLANNQPQTHFFFSSWFINAIGYNKNTFSGSKPF